MDLKAADTMFLMESACGVEICGAFESACIITALNDSVWATWLWLKNKSGICMFCIYGQFSIIYLLLNYAINFQDICIGVSK